MTLKNFDEFSNRMMNEIASHDTQLYGMLSQYSVWYSLKIIFIGFAYVAS